MFIFKLAIFIASACSLVLAARNRPTVQYEWKYVNYTWPTTAAYEDAVKNGTYIKENNPLAGIKLWKDKLYLTVPRWKDGVPATLLVTSVRPVDGEKSPLLEPYPNWDMQKIGGDCSGFQFVQSMEIDPMGRMWVIDTGRVATLSSTPRNLCRPRLVILDLENNGEILLNYVFPESVSSRTSAYLNDIVLDHSDGGYAYITDTDSKNPGIVVFSLGQRDSWRVTDPSMKATAVEFTVKHDGTRVSQALNVDGIALSPASERHQSRLLYYSPLSSLDIFSVPVRDLKSRPSDVSSSVKRLGRKTSQSDGMIMSANYRLFYGLLAENSVKSWDRTITFHDDKTMQWPDTFAIDEKGALWTVSNRLQRFLADKVNVSEVNFRVIKLADNINARSYMYYGNGEAPVFPSIE